MMKHGINLIKEEKKLAMLFQLKKDLTRKGPSKEWIENENLIKEKSYYVTHRKIRTFAFLDDKTKGSNWLQMRTRLQPIRTFSEITFKVKFM